MPATLFVHLSVCVVSPLLLFLFLLLLMLLLLLLMMMEPLHEKRRSLRRRSSRALRVPSRVDCLYAHVLAARVCFLVVPRRCLLPVKAKISYVRVSRSLG